MFSSNIWKPPTLFFPNLILISSTLTHYIILSTNGNRNIILYNFLLIFLQIFIKRLVWNPTAHTSYTQVDTGRQQAKNVLELYMYFSYFCLMGILSMWFFPRLRIKTRSFLCPRSASPWNYFQARTNFQKFSSCSVFKRCFILIKPFSSWSCPSNTTNPC